MQWKFGGRKAWAGGSGLLSFNKAEQIRIVSNTEKISVVRAVDRNYWCCLIGGGRKVMVTRTSCTGDENSFTYVSKPNFVDDSPNVFNPPPQPPMYSCEFCGNDARYGHYCTP
ncbi:hypothetical protein Tco_0962250 [Tanacetum coccineum]